MLVAQAIHHQPETCRHKCHHPQPASQPAPAATHWRHAAQPSPPASAPESPAPRHPCPRLPAAWRSQPASAAGLSGAASEMPSRGTGRLHAAPVQPVLEPGQQVAVAASDTMRRKASPISIASDSRFDLPCARCRRAPAAHAPQWGAGDER